jgi:putative transposase
VVEKKVRTESPRVRWAWIEPNHPALSLAAQCELLGLNRSTWYDRQAAPSALNLELMRHLDEEYTAHPFYGSRRMTAVLRRAGYPVHRKRVIRLMSQLGLVAIYPKPLLSRPNPAQGIYPYLLRGVTVTTPDQVWSTDMTYIRLLTGIVYLAAILDWYRRKVLAWRLSNTLETQFCLECLEDALRVGQRLIFNSDQGGSLPAPRLPVGWPKRESGSAGMGGAALMTISLWNGCGDRSSMRRSTPRATRRWRRLIVDCTATSSSITTNAPLRRWDTEHPPRCMPAGLKTCP